MTETEALAWWIETEALLRREDQELKAKLPQMMPQPEFSRPSIPQHLLPRIGM